MVQILCKGLLVRVVKTVAMLSDNVGVLIFTLIVAPSMCLHDFQVCTSALLLLVLLCQGFQKKLWEVLVLPEYPWIQCKGTCGKAPLT